MRRKRMCVKRMATAEVFQKKKRKVHPKGAKEKGHMRTNEESTKEVERESNE